MEYYSAIKRNAFESVIMRWMNLEPIIQSEVSQKEKYKYCILMHIYGIQKGGTNEFICKAAMEKTTRRTDEWIKKLWYIYTIEYYSAKKRNAFESVIMRWMNLAPIIHSEVSQKEKNKYRILMHIYGF